MKIAIWGAGRIGKIHAANVASHPDLSLACIADVDQAAGERLAARYGAKFSSIDTILDDATITGVVVATSTDTHLDLTLRAVAKGKAVLCEKPVGINLDRARKAIQLLEGANVLIGFNRRFDPGFASLREKLTAGEVGGLESLQITSNDPAAPPIDYVRVSGGLFADMTIHDFDMARFLLSEEPTEIFAWGSCLIDPAIGAAGDVDTARVMLRTASGRLCVIANSRRSGFGYDQRIEAFCARGMLAARNQTETNVDIWREDGAQSAPFRNFFLDRYAEAFRAEIDHFGDMVVRRTPPLVTYADGVAALALADAARRSLESGTVVRVEQLTNADHDR